MSSRNAQSEPRGKIGPRIDNVKRLQRSLEHSAITTTIMSESSEPAPPATSAASHDASLDKVLNAMSASRSGPEAAKKKEYTYADLQKVLDETPLFMRETPKESGDNYVLEALKSLVFEGEGDGG